jgi:hypothetical protein
MAITIDWGTRIISVPKADLLLVQSVPTEIRQLDLDAFRLELKSLEDDPAGMPFPITHNHVAPITVGGVTLARVVEILNGYTVTFEDGQYAVNLVGANSNVGDVVNVNQVSIRSANSAGLTFSAQINEQSFAGYVWVDVDNGLSGTSFPRGTLTDPVNNYADAKIISNRVNIKEFKLRGDLILSGADNISGEVWIGDGQANAKMVIAGGATSGAVLRGMTVEGDFNGQGEDVIECTTGNITSFGGHLYRCRLEGNVTVDAGATSVVSIDYCWSQVAGLGRPIVDLNGTAAPVSVRAYNGGMSIVNMTGGNDMSVDMASGSLDTDATNTLGNLVVRGNCSFDDTSNGIVVTDSTLNRDHSIINQGVQKASLLIPHTTDL